MRVFKYRGGDDSIFSRDLESLVNDTFWAPTRDMLNDPCEGLVFADTLFEQIDLTVNLLGKGSEDIANSAAVVKASLNDLIEKKDSSGVYSLSQSATDELLWAHYANSHEGFCIEYDLDTLMHFGKNDYFSFDVIYNDCPPKLQIQDMSNLKDRVGFIQKIIGVKSKK